MGLDIFYNVNNNEQVFDFDYLTNDELQEKHSLSRTFASFMSRKHVVTENEKPEIDQISEFTNIDLSSIGILDEIPNLDDLAEIMEFDPEYAETQKQEYEIQFRKIENNIDKLSSLLSELIACLNEKEDIYKLLQSTSFDSLHNASYFKKETKGSDNFYKDLNNFQEFVHYAQSKGTQTIWLKYQ